MAKGSAIVGKIWGSAGNLTFQTLKGQQVIKSKAEKVENPKTVGQVRTRSKFKWLGFMYNAMSAWLDHSFTNKLRKQSSMNKFFSINFGSAPTVCAKQTNIYQDPDDIEDCPNSDTKLYSYAPSDVMIANGSLENVTVNAQDDAYTAGAEGEIVTITGTTSEYLAKMEDISSVDAPSWLDATSAATTDGAWAATLEALGVDVDEMLSIGVIFWNGDEQMFNAFEYIRIKRTGESTVEIVNNIPSATLTAPSVTYTEATDDADATMAITGFTLTSGTSGSAFDSTNYPAGIAVVKTSYTSSVGWKASDAYLNVTAQITDLLTYGDDITKSVLTGEGYEVGDEDVLDPESIQE